MPALAAAARIELDRWITEEGRAAVVVPRSLREPLARALTDSLDRGTLGVGSSALDSRVSVLTVAEAKGLEFDQVIVAEPAAMLADSPRGGHDLYVALTRATQELVVVHAEELPGGFESGPGATTP